MGKRSPDKLTEKPKNGTPDKALAKRLMQELLDKAPAATLRVGGQTAKFYGVSLDAAKAHQLLEHCNWRNRSVRQTKVEQHAKKMKGGKWRLQNPLLFSEDGELLDGQHRLLGDFEAGVSVPFVIQMVAKDATDEANLAVDAGVPRNLVDYLHFHGVPQAVRTAPLLVLERNARVSRSPFQLVRAEKEDILRLYRSLPENLCADVFAVVPQSFHLNLGLKRAIVDWVALQLVQISKEDARVFFEMVADPSGLTAKDAPYVVSRRLLESAARSARTGSKAVPVEQAVLLVKAWNAYYQNQKITELHYKPREEFPSVAGMR